MDVAIEECNRPGGEISKNSWMANDPKIFFKWGSSNRDAVGAYGEPLKGMHNDSACLPEPKKTWNARHLGDCFGDWYDDSLIEDDPPIEYEHFII